VSLPQSEKNNCCTKDGTQLYNPSTLPQFEAHGKLQVGDCG